MTARERPSRRGIPRRCRGGAGARRRRRPADVEVRAARSRAPPCGEGRERESAPSSRGRRPAAGRRASAPRIASHDSPAASVSAASPMWWQVEGAKPPAGRDDRLERLTGVEALAEPVDDLGLGSVGMQARPGVGLAVHADDVRRALAQERGHGIARRPRLTKLRRCRLAATSVAKWSWRFTMASSGAEQTGEACRIALQDGRAPARWPRGSPRSGRPARGGSGRRRSARAGSATSRGSAARAGFALSSFCACHQVPSSTTSVMGDGEASPSRRRWRSGRERGRRRCPSASTSRTTGSLAEVDVGAQHRTREPQAREARGTDADVALARVLQDEHARLGRDGHQRPAETLRPRPPAAVAHEPGPLAARLGYGAATAIPRCPRSPAKGRGSRPSPRRTSRRTGRPPSRA